MDIQDLDIEPYKDNKRLYRELNEFKTNFEINFPLRQLDITIENHMQFLRGKDLDSKTAPLLPILPYQRNRSTMGKNKAGKAAFARPREYDPLSSYKKRIKAYIRENILLDGYIPFKGECYFHLTTYRKPPQNFSQKEYVLAMNEIIRPQIYPDVDNYEKILMDIFNEIIYEDDGQIVENYSRKFYGETPRVEISLYYRENPMSNKFIKKDKEEDE